MRRSFLSLLLALTLAAGLFVTPAAAAGAPQITVSSVQAQTTQTVGLSGLPADCQSLQVTLTLSDDSASYVFTPDESLDRPGLYATAQQSGAEVTVYVTVRSGVLSQSGVLTLGELSAGDKTFTVVSAGGLKLVDDTLTETPVYDSVSVVERTTTSSGTSSSRWAVEVNKAANGALSADVVRAKKGDTVTVTAVPDSGYVLKSLSVKDATGAALSLKELGDGRYTFSMPAAQVTVSAVFALESAGQVLPFADVAADAWYYDAVGYVYESGLMTGVNADQFAPEVTTTRGMIVTILYRMENSPAVTGGSGFPDVAAGEWYADAVKWASANGIVTGYSDGRFGPTDVITREQMAAILYRYAHYLGRDVSGQADLTGYSDAAQVSSYASTAMGWAVDAGLITGTGAGTLAPVGSATRAQAAVILMRLCQMGE